MLQVADDGESKALHEAMEKRKKLGVTPFHLNKLAATDPESSQDGMAYASAM